MFESERFASGRGMGPCRRVLIALLVLAVTGASVRGHRAAETAGPAPSSLVAVMQDELRRAFAELTKADPAAYFISYSAYDQETATLAATLGGVMTSSSERRRAVDIQVRVGDRAFDNTHGSAAPFLRSGVLPLEDNRDAVVRTLWQLTDNSYKLASTVYLNAKGGSALRAEEEDKSPDFSQESPHTSIDMSEPPSSPDLKAWQNRLRRCSARFLPHPDIYRSGVLFQVDRIRNSFVSSEGTTIVRPSWLARVVIQGQTLAPDGMELWRGQVLQAVTPGRLPPENEIAARVEKIAADLKALRTAPAAEPFDGPALLSGPAAAVFFHEVLGHRLEGHRQRDDHEGQTFTKRLNQQILPDFLSVESDPTLRELDGFVLTGGYDFDQEGVPSRRVELVGDGILKSFLMSRRPIQDFSHSNGHGRAEPGMMPTARQSNLIIRSSRAVAEPELRRRLIEEARKQGKPYGLYFEDVEGGFTLTQRSLPQSFLLLPVLVWRVYTDGRPDELIRGVDIVGTPLTAVRNIILTGEKLHVFNGMCGGESGQVPVSAVAPAMLLSQIETQKRAQSRELPPILPPPGFEARPGAPPATLKNPPPPKAHP